MKIKFNLKLDKSFVLLVLLGLLLGYYAGFLFSRQTMAFLYNFMPMMDTRLIPTTMYGNLICMVLGAFVTCVLYCILKRTGIIRQLLAAAAAVICIGLVTAAFSLHMAAFFNKLNNTVMDRVNIQYMSADGQGISFWHENSGNGADNSIVLEKGNGDLKELSKIIGRLKVSGVYQDGRQRRDSDAYITLFCNYTVSGEWFSRIISTDDAAAYSYSVKNYTSVAYDNSGLKNCLNTMHSKYRSIGAAKAASWADYSMYEKAGYNLEKGQQEIPDVNGLKTLLGKAPDFTPSKEDIARYKAYFADGIREEDGDMAVIELFNKGEDYEARSVILYDRLGGIAAFGPKGPYIKADLGPFLLQKPLAAVTGSSGSGQTETGKPAAERKFNLDAKSFITFKDAILETDLKSDKKENNIDSLYHITGSFDLDTDGKPDKITVTLGRRVNNQDSVMQINDKKLDYVFDNPGEIYICDLDKKDKFKEIAIYDDGPSGDPQLVFFRYDGNQIQKLGTVNGGAASISMDGSGRLLPAGGFLSPDIVTHMYELKNGEIQIVAVDYSDAMNREYTFRYNTTGYFAEMDAIPADYTPSWDENLKMNFKEGDKVKIKSLIDGVYEVELESGRMGVMYFWMGD